MLVFSKEDAQTDSFLHAAERGGYLCQICKTSEEAMEQYINVQPEVRLKLWVDKKIVCELRFSLSRPKEGAFLGLRDLITKFCFQSFVMPWMWDYQIWCLQDGRCKTRKEDLLMNFSKQDFISITVLVIVALILKVIRNYLFKPFHFENMVWYWVTVPGV